MHKNNVIHRDLKLGNLFLSADMKIKIGDLGLAASLQNPGERRKTVCGTPNYIAPQVLTSQDGHSFQVDIWSFGVIAYTLAIGKPPFETATIEDTYKKIKKGEFSFPNSLQLSQHLKEVIDRSLVVQPDLRASIQQLLNLPFFSQQLPKFIPISSLACPLSQAQIEQITRQRYTTREMRTVDLMKSGRFTRSMKREDSTATNDCLKAKTSSLRKSQKLLKELKRSPYLEGIISKEILLKQVKKYFFISNYKTISVDTKQALGYKVQEGGVGVVFQSSKGAVTKGLDKILLYSKTSQTQFTVAQDPITDQIQLTKSILLMLANQFYCHRKDLAKALVYVRKWKFLGSKTILKLNNNRVQIDFPEGPKVMFDPDQKLVVIKQDKKYSQIFLNNLSSLKNPRYQAIIKDAKRALTEANDSCCKQAKENDLKSMAKLDLLKSVSVRRQEKSRQQSRSKMESKKSSFRQARK